MGFDLGNSRLGRLHLSSLRHARRVRFVESALRVKRLVERGRHADALPSIPAPQVSTFAELVRDGLVHMPFRDIGVDVAPALRAARALAGDLERHRGTRFGRTSLHAPLAAVLEAPELFLLGLQRPVLDLVERYLGLPVSYLGVDVKRELVVDCEDGVRTWHFDIEDARMVKMIVYLNDVDDTAGPFQAVRRGEAERFKSSVGHLWGDSYSCAQLARHVPPEKWYSGVGAAEDVHIFDPARVLHRAGVPTRRDRYSMTFSFASTHAYFAYADVRAVQTAFRRRWSHLLDARQHATLTG